MLQQDFEDVRKNPSMILKELEVSKKEMKTLKYRAKLIDLYHNRMEELNNLKMEYAIMKAKLWIYQQRSKRSQVEQWKLHKEQVGEIIQEAFESY